MKIVTKSKYKNNEKGQMSTFIHQERKRGRLKTKKRSPRRKGTFPKNKSSTHPKVV